MLSDLTNHRGLRDRRVYNHLPTASRAAKHIEPERSFHQDRLSCGRRGTYSAAEARGERAREGVATRRAPHRACRAIYPGFPELSVRGGPGGATAEGGGRLPRLGLTTCTRSLTSGHRSEALPDSQGLASRARGSRSRRSSMATASDCTEVEAPCSKANRSLGFSAAAAIDARRVAATRGLRASHSACAARAPRHGSSRRAAGRSRPREHGEGAPGRGPPVAGRGPTHRRRIDWVDVLACPCGGRRAIVGDISDREVVVAILAHLGLPPFAPPIVRARSPGFDFT